MRQFKADVSAAGKASPEGGFEAGSFALLAEAALQLGAEREPFGSGKRSARAAYGGSSRVRSPVSPTNFGRRQNGHAKRFRRV